MVESEQVSVCSPQALLRCSDVTRRRQKRWTTLGIGERAELIYCTAHHIRAVQLRYRQDDANAGERW